MNQITSSTVTPTELLDKTNELVLYKQDLLTPKNGIAIDYSAKQTVLTAVSNNPNVTVTNNYTGTKSEIGTVVETYEVQNVYGYKYNNNALYGSSINPPTLNTTTGITSSNFQGKLLYTMLGSTHQVMVQVCFIIPSDKTGTQILFQTLNSTLYLSNIPNYNSLSAGTEVHVRCRQVSTRKISYSYSLNGSSFTAVKTDTLNNNQDWVDIGNDHNYLSASYYFKGTVNCTKSYLYPYDGSASTAFVLTDTTLITGHKWLLHGSTATLPNGVSVSSMTEGDTLTCTYVTSQVCGIGTDKLVDAYYVVKQTDIAYDDTVSKNIAKGLIHLQDKNDNTLSYIQWWKATSGVQGLQLRVKKNGSPSEYSTLNVGFDANGNAYCSFPHTNNVDGSIVSSDHNIRTDLNVYNSSSTPLYNQGLVYGDSSTQILPDNGTYLVLFTGSVITGTTSGNFVALQISSDLVGWTSVCGARTRSASSQTSYGAVWIPVSNRRFNIYRNSLYTGTVAINVKAYRRIGSNT